MTKWQSNLVFNNGDEFVKWLEKVDVYDIITEVHMHHTYSPNHSHYAKGYTTEKLHANMRSYHIGLGWGDIAQHITIGMDGKIVTGRDINKMPASAKTHNGNENAHPFMFEMIGNFDKGGDKFEGAQLDSALKVCQYWFGKGVKTEFHRQQLLNGKVPKTCPGSGIDYDWWIKLVEEKQVIVNDGEKKEEKPKEGEDNMNLPNGVIKSGHKNESEVKLIQKALLELGYKLPKFGADGDFGGETVDALKDFQKKEKLEADGIYGPSTKAKMVKLLKEKAEAEKKAKEKAQASKPKPTGNHAIYIDGKKVHTLAEDNNVLLFIEQNMNKVKEIKIVKE
jgi:hypothetical protein